MLPSIDLADLLGRAQRILRDLLLAIPNLLFGIVVLALFVGLAWAIGLGVRSVLRRAGQPPGVRIVVSRLVSWTVTGVGFLVAVTVVFPTLNAASLFGALGVTSVAIGFAFKDVFQNLLAGLLILLTRPFRIGDQIVSGDHEGTVEDILVRATLLRTYDNRRVVIPNSDLYTNRVVVNTAYERRRLAVRIGVEADGDMADVKAQITRTLAGIDGVLRDPAPSVLVVELADFATVLEVRFWVAPTERREAVETTDTVLASVKAGLEQGGFDLPYPTQRVIVTRPGPSSD